MLFLYYGLLIAELDPAPYPSEDCRRSGASYEHVNRNTPLSQFAKMYETFTYIFHSAVPKQSAKAYRKCMVSMSPGKNHIVWARGSSKWLENRELIAKFLKIVEPLAVKAQKRRRFKRK